MRAIAIALALVSTAVSVFAIFGSSSTAREWAMRVPRSDRANEAGDSYIRCTEGGWITVNRPPPVDFPGFFDCAGNPIRVGPKYTIPGEGTFRPNIDIRPGEYRTPGPSEAGQSCYWVLQHDVGVVSNNSQGPISVVIGPTDKAFQTSACQPWNPMY